MKKIIYKFPSRGRPNKFKDVLDKSIAFQSKKHHVRYVITMDTDDATMNNQEMRDYFKNLKDNFGVDIVYHYGDSKSKIEACNANLENESGDAVILVSDDMVPVSQDWDDIIVEVMDHHGYDIGVKFWDGLRPKQDPLMTLPVMGWKLYEAIGHLYHPSYTSLYSDNEMTQVCSMLGKFVRVDYCIFQHQWTPEPFDELHARNENQEMYKIDGAIFEQRQKEKFDIESVARKLELI